MGRDGAQVTPWERRCDKSHFCCCWVSAILAWVAPNSAVCGFPNWNPVAMG